jgi:hypothetical protein
LQSAVVPSAVDRLLSDFTFLRFSEVHELSFDPFIFEFEFLGFFGCSVHKNILLGLARSQLARFAHIQFDGRVVIRFSTR